MWLRLGHNESVVGPRTENEESVGSSITSVETTLKVRHCMGPGGRLGRKGIGSEDSFWVKELRGKQQNQRWVQWLSHIRTIFQPMVTMVTDAMRAGPGSFIQPTLPVPWGSPLFAMLCMDSDIVNKAHGGSNKNCLHSPLPKTPKLQRHPHNMKLPQK